MHHIHLLKYVITALESGQAFLDRPGRDFQSHRPEGVSTSTVILCRRLQDFLALSLIDASRLAATVSIGAEGAKNAFSRSQNCCPTHITSSSLKRLELFRSTHLHHDYYQPRAD
jgi:hypothetical protein